jgi:hypothetical protein
MEGTNTASPVPDETFNPTLNVPTETLIPVATETEIPTEVPNPTPTQISAGFQPIGIFRTQLFSLRIRTCPPIGVAQPLVQCAFKDALYVPQNVWIPVFDWFRDVDNIVWLCLNDPMNGFACDSIAAVCLADNTLYGEYTELISEPERGYKVQCNDFPD